MKSKLAIVFLIWACSSARAAEETEVSATFSLFSPGQAVKAVEFVSASKPVRVVLAEGMRSELQSYHGPKVLALREADGEKRTFQVELAPAESGPFLILLLAGPGSPRAVAIEDGLEDFPTGTIRFSNQTEKEFDVSASQIQATLAAGETSMFSLPKGKPTSLVTIRKSGGGDIVFSNNWSVAQNSRTLVLLLPSLMEANPNPTVIRLAESLTKP